MYIGIDLGTSGVKTILIDYNQDILATAHSPLTVQSPSSVKKTKTKRILSYNFYWYFGTYAWSDNY